MQLERSRPVPEQQVVGSAKFPYTMRDQEHDWRHKFWRASFYSEKRVVVDAERQKPIAEWAPIGAEWRPSGAEARNKQKHMWFTLQQNGWDRAWRRRWRQRQNRASCKSLSRIQDVDGDGMDIGIGIGCAASIVSFAGNNVRSTHSATPTRPFGPLPPCINVQSISR